MFDYLLQLVLRYRREFSPELLSSKLLDQDSFYPAFMKDLGNCRSEVIIESPFITKRRLNQLMPMLRRLKERNVSIIVNTRDPYEHDEEGRHDEARSAVIGLQRLGAQVLYTGGHHRKLIIVDRKILYEGSLNVLSQNSSSEIMRRTESTQLAWQMIEFVGLAEYF